MNRCKMRCIIAFCMMFLCLLSSCTNKQNFDYGDYWMNYQPGNETTSGNEQNVGSQNDLLVPEYWIDSLNKGVKDINRALLTAGSDKSAFFFYSDAHWNCGSQISPLLLEYLYEHTGINKTIFGGDIVNDETESYEGMQYLWEWRRMLKNLPNHHSVVGNHDDGNATDNLFSESYVYGYLLAAEETSDIVRADNGLYYYIDNPAEKTRYLYLDTAYIGLNSLQKQFVKNALLTTPEEWHIIAVAHCWYNVNYTNQDMPVVAELSNDGQKLLDMFDDYNNRIGEYSSCGARMEFCIGGHAHVDYDGRSEGGIPIILVETDSGIVRNRSNDPQYQYQKGTDTEASVNAIVADYDHHKIYVIRIGRGISRSVDLVKQEKKPNNVLGNAFAADGESIYCDVGYQSGVRWSSSQQKEVLKAGTYLSGWIPISEHDIIRLQNADMNKDSDRCAVFFAESIGATAASANMSTLETYYKAVFEENDNLIQFKVVGNYNYIRIQCEGMDSDTIITINELIEEG